MSSPEVSRMGRLALLPVVAGSWVLVLAGPAAEPTTRPHVEETRTSPWGKAVHGLQARVRLPAQVEQNAPIEVSFEIECKPHQLPAGVSRLNTRRLPTLLRLTLTDVSTSDRVVLKPYDPNGPPEPTDSFVALSGRTVPPFRISFPLLRSYPMTRDLAVLGWTLRSEAEPGLYDGVVSYSYSLEDGSEGLGTEKEKSRFWTGSFCSAPVRIKIVPETPKTKTLVVPKRLRIEGHYVVFGKDDSEEVKRPIRNGCFIGTRITGGDGTAAFGLWSSCWDQPGKGARIGDLNNGDPKRRAKERTLTYTIEIFETARLPESQWRPAPGADGYRTLWNETFTLIRKPDSRPK
jgi:hypothetical protein